MRNKFHVIIVGGGASGLLCALELLNGDNPFNGEDIAIIEKNDRVGKKLLATGNGQCNLSNANLIEERYHGDREFIKEYISNVQKIDIEKYFTNLGVPFITAKDGKQYPVSKQASSVLDSLRENLIYKKCNFILSTKVQKIDYKNNIYELNTNNGIFYAETVVFAFGGKAGKQFGTDGRSYELCESIGHTKTKLYPAIVQLKTELDKIKGLKGLKENVNISAYDGDRFLASSTGDVLFTEYGVSGNSVFFLSSYLVNAYQPNIVIKFLPEMSDEDTERIIDLRLKLPYVKKEDILCGIVNKKIGQAILKTVKSYNAKEILHALKNFSLKITGNLDFDYAQVTKGGIRTEEIDNNYESKKSKRIFLIGELLDVDGDCGGYNLTFAFASGIISARQIKKQKS